MRCYCYCVPDPPEELVIEKVEKDKKILLLITLAYYYFCLIYATQVSFKSLRGEGPDLVSQLWN